MIEQRFRTQIYCWNEQGRLSLTDPSDVFASDIDTAACKVTGGDVRLDGSIHKVAAKVWDMHGNIRRYYRN